MALSGNFSFGRSQENNIVLTVPKASRKHATIVPDSPEGYLLIDLNSRNGTFLNGRRVSQPTRLHDGDRITVADVVFTFRQQNSPHRRPPEVQGTGSETLMVLEEKPTWLVMADMEGFTEMARQLSPQELASTSANWYSLCNEAVERTGGNVGKAMGDGLLAYWEAMEGATPRVVEVLEALRGLQAQIDAPFRVVVHYGKVSFGGAVRLGEEGMIGADVNFTFRLEKLAASLGEPFCISANAAQALGEAFPVAQIAGEHTIKGFPGVHIIHRPLWVGLEMPGNQDCHGR